MPNAVCDTGAGATVTLSTTAFTSNITEADLGEESINDIDKSHLGSAGYRQTFPGDLKEAGEVTIPYQFDNEEALPAVGVVENVTVTFPLATKIASGALQTTNATLAGSGYIKSVQRPTLAIDTLQSGQIVFKFDGTTGPVYTPGS